MKLLYVIRHPEEKIDAINVSYCGSNALDILLDFVEAYNYDIDLVLLHKDGLYKCKEHDYLINNEIHVNNLLYL